MRCPRLLLAILAYGWLSVPAAGAQTLTGSITGRVVDSTSQHGRTVEAIPRINQIRTRAFSPPKPLSASLTQAQVRDAIFDERQFELIDEGKRRPDMIRQGTWLLAGWNKQADPAGFVLMPIPQSQIDANPMLVQNAGY